MQAKPEQQKSNELVPQTQNKLFDELRASEKRYQELVEHLKDIVFQLDTNLNWTFLNHVWFDLTGKEVIDTLDQPFELFFGQEDVTRCYKGFNQLLRGEIEQLTEVITYCHDNGNQRIFELSAKVVKDGDGQLAGCAGILSDITIRVEAENKISHMAYHDALTGVANRRLLMEHLNKVLSDPTPPCTALIYIDLDNFKHVNDHYGHAVGDQLLIEVSQKLTQCVTSQADIVARMGGDEFIIFISNISSDNSLSVIKDVTHNIQDKLTKPILHGYLTTQITCSLGVVMLEHSNINYADIFKYADAALYCAKHAGKNQVRFYDAQLEHEERKRKRLHSELAEALEQHQFCLHFQPLVDDSRGIHKAEVLLRWQHPEHGLVSPDDFIPHLEEYGLIVPIGAWTLTKCCKYLQQWNQEGHQDLCLSINVSANQFNHPGFIEFVRQCLNEYDIDAQQIELELTETTAIENVHATINKMSQLREMGIRLALDDFGTGYSSLSYLKHLPICTLKIDRSFIQGLPDDGYDAAIVETTMVMANHLGLTVVAEGVENQIQRQFLQKLHCHYYQGYLFHRPLPVDDFYKLLPLIK